MKKLLMYGVILLAMIGIVNAASTFNNPLDSGTLTGTVGINITTSTFVNVTNCTITGSSAITGNTTAFILLGDGLDAAALDDNASAKVDISVMMDANDWTFTGNCYENNSAGNVSAVTAVANVIVNDGTPTCTLSGFTANSLYDVDSTNTLTVTSINGSSAATAYIDTAPHTMTKGSWAGETITYTYTLDYPDGTYDIYATVTDGTDTTTCAVITGVTLTPKQGRGGGGGTTTTLKTAQPQAVSTQEIKDKLSGNIAGIPIWIIIAAVFIYLGMKNKWFK